jgi:hypothetical protein
MFLEDMFSLGSPDSLDNSQAALHFCSSIQPRSSEDGTIQKSPFHELLLVIVQQIHIILLVSLGIGYTVYSH